MKIVLKLGTRIIKKSKETSEDAKKREHYIYNTQHTTIKIESVCREKKKAFKEMCTCTIDNGVYEKCTVTTKIILESTRRYKMAIKVKLCARKSQNQIVTASIVVGHRAPNRTI